MGLPLKNLAMKFAQLLIRFCLTPFLVLLASPLQLALSVRPAASYFLHTSLLFLFASPLHLACLSGQPPDYLLLTCLPALSPTGRA